MRGYDSPKMKTVPAKNGWLWIVRGFDLFRRSPAMWILLVFAYWMLIRFVNEVPLVGSLAATLFLPAFSVSFMVMCEELELGRRIHPALLFAGFRRGLPTLVTMGGVYLASILTVIALSAIADGGALFNWVVRATPPPESAVDDGSLARAQLLAAVLGTPIAMAFWFAPVLAAWNGMGAGKALFFSFFAGLRNWRAFLVYGGVLASAGLVLSMLLSAILHARGNVDALRLVLFTAALLVLPTLFGSFYAAYRDVFPPSAAPEEPSTA